VARILSGLPKQFVFHLCFGIPPRLLEDQGSGKTLAYGLPILHHLLSYPQKLSVTTKRRQLKALILAPTRELALQVSNHLKECLSVVNDSVAEDEPADNVASKAANKNRGKQKAESIAQKRLNNSAPLLSIAAIVGGMSSQRQRRILDRGLDVLVATPGRLWDIMEEVSPYCRFPLVFAIYHLRFLVPLSLISILLPRY
jgi:ATP-dependent RNA helicase DDX24/MAK5